MFFIPAVSVAGFVSRCRAYRSGVQLIAKDTHVKVEFNAEQYDVNNEFDITTNHRWTCKVAGEYHIDTGIPLDPIVVGETVWLKVKHNGITYIIIEENRPGYGGQVVVTCSGDYRFVVDDYIEVFIYHTSTIDRNTYHADGDPWFNVHRIG